MKITQRLQLVRLILLELIVLHKEPTEFVGYSSLLILSVEDYTAQVHHILMVMLQLQQLKPNVLISTHVDFSGLMVQLISRFMQKVHVLIVIQQVLDLYIKLFHAATGLLQLL
jgi:hypothetical protein